MVALSFQTNLASLRASTELDRQSSSISKSLERLSSGLRINKAGDDAAGLAVSQDLELQSRIYSQGLRNINDAVSALAIEDAALQALSNIVLRQKELAEQAANGVYSLDQRQALHDEADSLTVEFNRIIQSTEYNGLNLTNGDLSGLRVQVGKGLDGSIAFSIGENLSRTISDDTFGTRSSVLSGDILRLETADFNGDGYDDYTTIDFDANEIQIRINDGDGGFSSVSFSIPGDGEELALFDANGDGNVDVIAGGNDSGTSSVTTFYGDGTGGFTAGSEVVLGAFLGGMEDLKTGDFNNDGLMDVIFEHSAETDATIAYGNGDGTFGSITSIATGGSIAGDIAVGDFNGDGLDDFSLYDSTNSQLEVHYNDGNGSFTADTSTVAASHLGTLNAGDFNRDGVQDLAIFDYADNEIHIYTGREDGSLQFHNTFSQSVSGASATIADQNGDGYLDLISIADTNTIFVYQGDGTGEFNLASSGILGTTDTVRLADMNGDGALDLISGQNGSSNNIYVNISGATDTTEQQYFNLNTIEGAREALSTLDETLQRINEERGAVGSIESRLSSALSVVRDTVDQFREAKSRIADVDVAFETAQLIQQQVRRDATTAVLAQANQQIGIALRLLES